MRDEGFRLSSRKCVESELTSTPGKNPITTFMLLLDDSKFLVGWLNIFEEKKRWFLCVHVLYSVPYQHKASLWYWQNLKLLATILLQGWGGYYDFPVTRSLSVVRVIPGMSPTCPPANTAPTNQRLGSLTADQPEDRCPLEGNWRCLTHVSPV